MNMETVTPHSLGMADLGEKVRFLDANGYEEERVHAREVGMLEGDVVTVAEVSIGGWSSSYRFVEYGGRYFNTVMFEPVDAA